MQVWAPFLFFLTVLNADALHVIFTQDNANVALKAAKMKFVELMTQVYKIVTALI